MRLACGRLNERVRHVGVPYIIGGVAFICSVANGVHIAAFAGSPHHHHLLCSQPTALSLASSARTGPSMAINLAVPSSAR
jgi:hypothetical protein